MFIHMNHSYCSWMRENGFQSCDNKELWDGIISARKGWFSVSDVKGDNLGRFGAPFLAFGEFEQLLSWQQLRYISLSSEGFPYFTDNFLLSSVSSTHLVPWCSGHHICFTRRRSWVQTPVEPYNRLYWALLYFGRTVHFHLRCVCEENLQHDTKQWTFRAFLS